LKKKRKNERKKTNRGLKKNDRKKTIIELRREKQPENKNKKKKKEIEREPSFLNCESFYCIFFLNQI
jgi:hypothetical protein